MFNNAVLIFSEIHMLMTASRRNLLKGQFFGYIGPRCLGFDCCYVSDNGNSKST